MDKKDEDVTVTKEDIFFSKVAACVLALCIVCCLIFAPKYALIPGCLLILLGPMIGAKVGDKAGGSQTGDGGAISAGSSSSSGGCGGGGDAC